MPAVKLKMVHKFLCVKQFLVTKKVFISIAIIILVMLVRFRPQSNFQSRQVKNKSDSKIIKNNSAAEYTTDYNAIGIPTQTPSFPKSDPNASPDDQACQVPKLSPFGPDTAYIGSTSSPPSCYDSKKLRFRIDYQNNLLLQNTNQDFFQNVECQYTPVIRDPDRPDFSYKSSNLVYPVNSSITKLAADSEHINIVCVNDDKTIYEDYLSAVQEKPKLEEELSQHRKSEEFYSVMIIGQDSTSNMNFKRFMPKTHNYLVNKMGAVEFSGFNSLGPGTLWSVFALFTGLDLNQYRNLCWPGETGYRDKCPHIWKDFAAHGYRTAYDEDKLGNGIFNEGGKQGFEKSQFHYDFRTASNLLESVHAGHVSGTHCYGSRLSFSVLVENMCRMATTFVEKPFWAFMWAQSLTHSELNSRIKYSEKSMMKSLKHLNENKLLNNTILIMFSDHGQRYGEFRKKTRQGFLEERLPILYIVLPEKFRAKFPRAAQNFEENAGKLTTAFDAYEMMKDLLDLTQITDQALEVRAQDITINTRRNVSLFLPINPHRTCAMIGFSFIYCACLHQESVPTNDKTVVKAARLVLESINRNLTAHPQCHPLTLKKITQAFKLGVKISRKDEYDRFSMTSHETDRAVGEHFEIGLETAPGNGAFDVSFYKKGNGESRIEDATRVTAYGNNGDCMPVKSLRPFCICKDNG